MKVFKSLLRPLYDYALHLQSPTTGDSGRIENFEALALSIPYKSIKSRGQYRSLLGVESTKMRHLALAYRERGRLEDVLKIEGKNKDVGDANMRCKDLVEINHMCPYLTVADQLLEETTRWSEIEESIPSRKIPTRKAGTTHPALTIPAGQETAVAGWFSGWFPKRSEGDRTELCKFL